LWAITLVIVASNTQFDSRGWVFGLKPSDEDITEIEYLRVVTMATNFGAKGKGKCFPILDTECWARS